MTLQQCTSCGTWMTETTHQHRCPRCGKTQTKTGYSEYHGRASLYPNHTSSTITLAPGLFRLIIYITVLLSVLLILGYSMDSQLMST